MKQTIYLFLFFLIAGIMSSCNKNVQPALPGDGTSVKINYYTNSDVLLRYNLGAVNIFVDSAVNSHPDYSRPVFDFQAATKTFEFPVIFGNTGVPVYGNYAAGQHHFLFNYMLYDSKYSKLVYSAPFAELSTVLDNHSEILFYLADAPVKAENADPQFNLISLPTNRLAATDSDKVAITILHQGPDSGPVTCSQVKKDGTLSTDNLPQNLNYGQNSGQLLLNVKDASNGIIGLNFYNKATGQLSISAGIPANGGHAYVLSLQGFQQDHSFKLPSNVNDADGTVAFTNTTVTANFRATIRQIW